MSWLMIEAGWTVVGADGAEIGRVTDVDADTEKDIFSGLNVRTGLLGAQRYVPSEHVARITEGRIELNVTGDELQNVR